MLEQTNSQIEPPAVIHEMISSDSLTFLPNLYYRKYKLIEKLSNLRYGFPEQRILVPRKLGSWDLVIAEAKELHERMVQRRRYNIAEKYHLAKAVKDRAVKSDLKREELYMYQRLVGSCLAEGVRKRYQDIGGNQDAEKRARGGSIAGGQMRKNQSQNQNLNQGQNSVEGNLAGIASGNNSVLPNEYQSGQNNIFIENQEDNEPLKQQGDFLQDLWGNGNQIPALSMEFKRQSEIMEDNFNNGIGAGQSHNQNPQNMIKQQVKEQEFGERKQQASQMPRGDPISGYLLRFIAMEGKNKLQSSSEKEKMVDESLVSEEKDISFLETQKFTMINRKQCLKKLNEDLRRRNKNKGGESNQNSSNSASFSGGNNLGSIPGVNMALSLLNTIPSGSSGGQQQKSFGSATIALNNLINLQNEPRPDQAIEVPSILEPVLYAQAIKTKRKREDAFQLRWSEDKLEELRGSNPQFDIKKAKFNDPALLTLLMVQSQQEYHKHFEKSIKSKKGFPGHLKDLPVVRSAFDRKATHEKGGEHHNLTAIGNGNDCNHFQGIKQRYYNEFYDRQYELFVMRNNKQKLMEKFMKASEFIFPESSACSGFLESSDNVPQGHQIEEACQISAKGQPVSMGRLFVNPKVYLSGRVIYKVHRGQLSAVVRPLSLRSQPQKTLSNKEREKTQISAEMAGLQQRVSYGHLVLLSFLVRRYLSLYGNNWRLISECIRMNPCFSHMMVGLEMVQELYQYVELRSSRENEREIRKRTFRGDRADPNDFEANMGFLDNDEFGLERHQINGSKGIEIDLEKKKQLEKDRRIRESLRSLGKIQLWEKKILPFEVYTSGSYEKFDSRLQCYTFIGDGQTHISSFSGGNIDGVQTSKIKGSSSNLPNGNALLKRTAEAISKGQNTSRNERKSFEEDVEQEDIKGLDLGRYKQIISRKHSGSEYLSGHCGKPFRGLEGDYDRYLKIVRNPYRVYPEGKQDDDYFDLDQSMGNPALNQNNNQGQERGMGYLGFGVDSEYVSDQRHRKTVQKFGFKKADTYLSQQNKSSEKDSSRGGPDMAFIAFESAHGQRDRQRNHNTSQFHPTSNSHPHNSHLHPKRKKIVNQKTSELVRVLQSLRKGLPNSGGNFVAPGAAGGSGRPAQRGISGSIGPVGPVASTNSTGGNMVASELAPSSAGIGANQDGGNRAGNTQGLQKSTGTGNNASEKEQTGNSNNASSNAVGSSVRHPGRTPAKKAGTGTEKKEQVTPEKKSGASKPKKRLKKDHDKNQD